MVKRFQTKDLMISIRGEEESELGGRQFCPPLSGCGLTIHCLLGNSIGCGLNYSCPGGGSVLDPTLRFTPWVQPPDRPIGGGLRNLEDVQALRKELEVTMKQLDEVEAEMAGPRTLEEAADLESKLEDALKEVKARKKKLEKRG